MKIDKYEKMAANYPDEILHPFNSLYKSAGFKALYFLADEFGGTTIYIPKKKTIFKDCLSSTLKEEYDGNNLKELAKKYDYSINGIKKLIRDPS